MKKQLLSMVAVLGMSVASFAQIGPVSLGAEIALPLGDFGDAASFGYGLSAGYEHPINEKLGVTANVGYVMLSVDDAAKDFIKNYSMMPIQAGVRYYLSEKTNGLYFHGQVGVHNLSVTTNAIDLGILDTIPETTTSDSYLSFALGAGF
ncbi:MAG: outer membrane beta-barrel protein, partial [Flavobacteriales bacterium]